ncbi:MAG TPA: mycothiol synthase [Acidimicrobiia bacterium]|nr:mycothiol synthase [Acidimicrobiia bacterium]
MDPAMEIQPGRLEEELREIEALIESVERVDGHRPIGERKAIGLTRDPNLIGLVGRSRGRIAAFVALTPASGDRWAMEMAIAPEFRQHKHYRRLFEAAVGEVRRRGGKSLRAWLFHPGLATAAVREGFKEERQLFKMEHHGPLPVGVAYPPGIEVTSFRPGRDEADLLRLNNEAFGNHPENGAWTAAELGLRTERDWFHPEMVLMAWRGTELVGFNWLKAGESEGEIYVIAVAPEAQGQGLGRALVLDGLIRLAKAGAEKSFLYVDADNHTAVHLYRDLGFYVDHVDRSFVRVV